MSDDIRPAVLEFAKEMEAQLKFNDHKGDWIGADPQWLMCRLLDEVIELQRVVLFSEGDPAEEAADVANFAMMIADVLGGLVYRDE